MPKFGRFLGEIERRVSRSLVEPELSKNEGTSALCARCNSLRTDVVCFGGKHFRFVCQLQKASNLAQSRNINEIFGQILSFSFVVSIDVKFSPNTIIRVSFDN